MNFLLDTDTCSAHMRRPAKLAHRFQQIREAYGGRAPKVLDPFAGGGAILPGDHDFILSRAPAESGWPGC
jgi:hypothetical protein